MLKLLLNLLLLISTSSAAADMYHGDPQAAILDMALNMGFPGYREMTDVNSAQGMNMLFDQVPLNEYGPAYVDHFNASPTRTHLSNYSNALGFIDYYNAAQRGSAFFNKSWNQTGLTDFNSPYNHQRYPRADIFTSSSYSSI